MTCYIKVSKIQFFCGVIEKKMSTDALQHVLNNTSVLVMGYTVNFIVTVFLVLKWKGCTEIVHIKYFVWLGTMIFEIIKVFKYMSALN